MTHEGVGERIRARREELGLHQGDVAAPGVTPQYISKIERGQRTPSMKALRRIAVPLQTTPQWLETGVDELLLPLTRVEAECVFNLLDRRRDRCSRQIRERLAKLLGDGRMA